METLNRAMNKLADSPAFQKDRQLVCNVPMKGSPADAAQAGSG
ncbi:MAG TPA: hypothetical protein VLK85_22090 [Ramlibacter sp.]|nr:hypothetical protein [Ramlibacter sp.]